MTEARKRGNKRAKLEIPKGDNAKPKTGRLRPKESSNALRTFFSSPTFNVIALACLLVTVFAGIRLFSANRNPAQVAFVEQAGFDQPETSNMDNRNYSAPEIFRGEVYDTSIRLRETGALGMAISLAVFADFSEKKNIPANLKTILATVQARGLMPPEMTFENGKLESASSAFYIRYKSQPLAFEILSRPKQSARMESPSLMMRFPLMSLDKRTITYFQSSRTNPVEMPEPFAPLERIVAAGWTIEQWRGELLPKNADAARILAEEKLLLGNAANNQ